MDFDSIIGRHILFVCYNGLNVTCLSFVKNILYCYKNTMSCIKTYTENILYEYKYKYISMIRHQRQQHLNIHILCMLVEIKLVGPLLRCFYASGPWCNAQILLDGPLFALRNWYDSSDWFKKKHLHFRCTNVRGLCGSIHRNHRVRYSFRFFALSVERPFHWKIRQKYWGRIFFFFFFAVWSDGTLKLFHILGYRF